jgi:hypothetical protein
MPVHDPFLHVMDVGFTAMDSSEAAPAIQPMGNQTPQRPLIPLTEPAAGV